MPKVSSYALRGSTSALYLADWERAQSMWRELTMVCR